MLFFFLALFVLALLLCGPLALILHAQNRGASREWAERQRALEARIAALERGGRALAPAPAPAAEAVPPAVAVEAVAAVSPTAPSPVPARLERARAGLDLETWVGGAWLTWLGILAIFFGTAFFLAYDLGESPLSGTGQLLAGLLVGAAFILAGRRLTRRAERFLGRGLLGGGVALLYLTAYAAYGFHELVPALVVFPFLLGASLVGGALALLENSLMVASLTQVGAFLTPLLLARGGDPGASLFLYLIAVSIGTAWVAARRRWHYLPLSAFLGTVVLVAQWWFEFHDPTRRGIPFSGVGALWLLYLGLPLIAAPERGFWGTARHALVIANGVLFAGFLYALLAPDLKALRGLSVAVLALVYAGVGAAAGRRRLGGEAIARAFRVTAIVLAALAVPIQFDLAWVTLGWSALAAALLWTGTEASYRGDRILAYGIYVLAAGRVLTFDTHDSLLHFEVYRPVLNGNFLVGAAAAASLAAGAWFLHRRRGRLESWEGSLVHAFVLAAAAVFLWRVSVESVAFFALRERLSGASTRLASLLTLSLIWALYAGLLIAAGFAVRYRPVRILGVVVLGILILKVFFLDAQALERGYRVASFVGVGFLLLSISILYQRERRA